MIALAVLVSLAALVPALRYLGRKYFQVHALYYRELGISFVIDRHDRVQNVILSRAEDYEIQEGEEPGEDKTIYPGRGVGRFSFGVSYPREVREEIPGKRGGDNKGIVCFLQNKEYGLDLLFVGDQLTHIWLNNRDYRTEEGVGPGSRGEEVIAAYGEIDRSAGYQVGRFVNLRRLASCLLFILILAGVLAFFAAFVFGPAVRFRVLWLILIALSVHLIYTVVLHSGLQFPAIPTLSVGLVIGLVIVAVSQFLLGPLLVIGWWWGETIARNRKFNPVGRYLTTGTVILIFSAGYFAILGMMPLLIHGFYLGIWWPLAIILDPVIQTVQLAVLAPIFYLAFIQFNLLFARTPPFPKVQPVL